VVLVISAWIARVRGVGGLAGTGRIG